MRILGLAVTGDAEALKEGRDDKPWMNKVGVEGALLFG